MRRGLIEIPERGAWHLPGLELQTPAAHPKETVSPLFEDAAGLRRTLFSDKKIEIQL
jgi:hypothetical protein